MNGRTRGHHAIWLSGALEDGVQPVNGYPVFGLAKWLEACFLLLRAKAPFNSFNEYTNSAAAYLDMLLHKDSIPPLDVSRQPAIALRAVLQEVQDLHRAKPDDVGDEALFQKYNWAFIAFDNALQLELGRLPVFYVTQKGVFDTRYLILDAAATYDGYKDRLPEEVKADTNEAGRCMAFNLPTAAGFHIARATESTMIAAMGAFGCPAIPKKERSWGTFINSLREHGASEKVVDHLKQIKDLHRNPLLHPEQTLQLQEAMSLWAVCTSVIQAMVADMERKRENPSPEIVAMLPPGDDDCS